MVTLKKKTQKNIVKATKATRRSPSRKKGAVVGGSRKVRPRPSDDDVLELVGTAEEKGSEAHEKRPAAKTWGLFSYGDAPGGMGGGVGAFLWFSSKRAMLDYVADLMPYSPPGPSGIDGRDVSEKARKIVDDIASGKSSDAAGLKRLNVVLRGFSQISWFGQFSDLLEGRSKFARDVRTWYRSDDVTGVAAAAPIKAAERAEFLEILWEYGA